MRWICKYICKLPVNIVSIVFILNIILEILLINENLDIIFVYL